MAKQVNMQEAQSRLSELGELAWKGERVVIAREGRPYLDLLPHRDNRRPRRPGRFAGQIEMAPDFDETPEEVIDAFEKGG